MAVLSTRELNRATLDRQSLLARSTRTPLDTVGHLVGMQAQAPFPPYTGLWTRLVDFDPHELGQLITGRQVVRVALMRGTVHLVTADDCLTVRPVVQEVLDRALRHNHARRLGTLDLNEIVHVGRELVEQQPRSTAELGRLLLERWPEHSRDDLVNVVRGVLPLVQLPPRGVWGRSGQPTVTTARTWLGRDLATDTTPDELVLRYLRAFGPASVADVQKWSGLTRLRTVVDRLRPQLHVCHDDRGVELYDLPEAPRPDPDTPAPVRFLPEFDNLLIGYADARRVIADDRRRAVLSVNGIVAATVLVDGYVAGMWTVRRTKRAATLEITLFEPVSPARRADIEQEGERLLAFTAPDATTRDIRFPS